MTTATTTTMTMRNNESPKLHKNEIRHAGDVAVNRREKYEERQSHTQSTSSKELRFAASRASRRSGGKHLKS